MKIFLQAVVILFCLLTGIHANAQFEFSDNAINYSIPWANGDNEGTGFNPWVINSTGGSAGTFIGNPAANGMGTTGIGTTAFGLFGHTGNEVTAIRNFVVPMLKGDVFEFYWAMNWDANGGFKGFNLRSGGTEIFNAVNSGFSSQITYSGVNSGTISNNYGTDPMLVTITRTEWNEYNISITRRDPGEGVFSTTLISPAPIDNIRIFIGNQGGSDGNRNIFFNGFHLTKAEPYETNGDLADPRILTGTSDLTKTGTGNLTLDAANTFTGNTVINENFLIISDDNRLGAVPGSATPAKIQIGGGVLGISSTLTIDANRGLTLTDVGSAIDVFGGQSATYNGIIAGSGIHDFNKAGPGTLELGGINTFSGVTTVSNGILRINHQNALGTTAAGTTVNSGAVLELNAGADYPAENLTLNGFGISDGGALRKIDTGNREFNGEITLGSDARIMVEGGTLEHRAPLNLAGNTVYIGGSQNYDMSTGSSISGATKTTGDGAIFKDGSGFFILRPDAGLTGSIRLVEGELRTFNTIPAGGELRISEEGIISSTSTADREIAKNTLILGDVFIGGTAGGRNGAIEFTGNFDLGGDTRELEMTYTNRIPGTVQNGGLTKTGPGTLTLSGSNTYGGDTRIQVGDLNAASVGAFGGGTDVFISAGATLTVSSSTSAASVREQGTSNGGTATIESGAVLTVNGANKGQFFQNSIGGAGGLTMAGSGNTNMTLYGTQSYSGPTAVSSGQLTTGPAMSTGSLTVTGGLFLATAADILGNTIPVTVNGGIYELEGSEEIGSLEGTGGSVQVNANDLITGGNNGTTTYDGQITGTGTLTKLGTGAFTLGGNNTFTGLTTVSAGQLSLGGTAGVNTITGDILVDGGVLDYANAEDNQINNTSTLTIDAGSADFGVRTETIGTLNMTGGDLIKGNNILTIGSASDLTGGKVETTSDNSSVQFNGDLTLGDVTIEHSGTNGEANNAMSLSGNIFVNDGTSPTFTIATGASAARLNLNSAIRTIEVGNAASLTMDFILWGSTNSSTGIIKEGPGILTLNADNLYTNTTTLRGGTLEIGADERIDSGSNFVFDGGTFASGGFNETVGTLDLQSDSEIALGPGDHTLTFAASNGVAWDGTAELTITGWTGTEGVTGTDGKIFVGGGPNTLTSTQLNQITFDGFGPARLLPSGELVPRDPSLTVTVPGALLFPFAVPQGNPSAVQSFEVEAEYLTNQPTVTAPTGYEISLNAGGPYTPSLQIPLSDPIGTVNSTDVYVRMTGISQGEFNDVVTVSEATVPDEEVTVRGAVLTPDTEFIDFDDNANWTAGSGGLGSYQTDHVYSDQDWTFTGGEALRETSPTQNGFPGTLGTYSWRLQNAAVTWTATYEETGTVTSFGFKVRRWDDSPNPDWEVSYSTDAGASFTTLETVNNAYLFNASQWRVFNYVLPTSEFVPDGNLVVQVTRSGGERIMIDDFFFDIALVPCVNPEWHYRSVSSGNWADPTTWEHSVDGNAPWTLPTCGPSDQAASIAVRDEVEVTSVISLKATTIESGAKILFTGGVMEIFDGPGDDLVVETSGVFEFDGADVPQYQSANVRIRIAPGGVLRVSDHPSGLSGNVAGNNSSNRIIYEDGAVYEHNTASPFVTSGQVYFPDVDDTTIPIFRITGNTSNVGAGSATTINGIFEANGNIGWGSAGAKNFRNGITGLGNVTQSGSGPFNITGTTAVLGGTGTINIAGNGMNINQNTSCELISDKTINGTSGASFRVWGTLNCKEFSVGGTYNNVTIGSLGNANAVVLTENEGGLIGANSAFENAGANYSLHFTSTVIYNRTGVQIITPRADYGNVHLRGTGTKSFTANTEIAGSLRVEENAALGSTNPVELSHSGDLIITDLAEFSISAYDNLNFNVNGSGNQFYNSTNGAPIRAFDFTSVKAGTNISLRLAQGTTPLEVKNDLDLSFTGSAQFRDSLNLIQVGGNATLDGSTGIGLTGTLEMTGAGTGTDQTIIGEMGGPIITPLNNLIVSGTKPVFFVPASGTATIVINGDVDIEAGLLNPQNNTLDLRGNWTNYSEAGFAEGSGRIDFRGSGDQTIACPGGEVFSRLLVAKSGTGDFILNDNLSLSGSGTGLASFSQVADIDLNGNTLRLTGGAGDITFVTGGTVLFKGAPGSAVIIEGSGNKAFLSTGAVAAFDDNVTLRLNRGLDCGAGGITEMRAGSVFEMGSNGFVNVSGPLYEDFSILRYATGGSFNRGIEWENMASNIRYPYDVEVQGTALNMATGGTVRGIRGDLTIYDGGSLNMGSMSAALEVIGDVNIGDGSGNGTMTLSNSIGGDLQIGGDLFRHPSNGSLIQNNREIAMIGDGNDQNIFNVDAFDYLGVVNNGGSVVLHEPTLIDIRLRLSDGLLDLESEDVDVTMDDGSFLMRNNPNALMSRSPVVDTGEQYDLLYMDQDITTDLEFSPEVDAVRDVTFQGFLNFTLGGDRTFNRHLNLNGPLLNLGGHVLTARGHLPDSGGLFAGEIRINLPGTRRITGPAGSRLDITGTGGFDEFNLTRQFVRNDGSELIIEAPVEVRIGDGGCDFGVGNPVTIEGVLAVRGGGYATGNACFYADNSVLRFANGFDYTVGTNDLTWAVGDINSNQPGIPFNVEVDGASSELFMNSPRALRNDIDIEDGKFTLTENSGTFALGGSWTRSGPTSQFNHNEQEVIFRGAGPQTITTPVSIGEVFYRLSFDSTGTKTLNEDVTVLRDLEIRSTGAVVGTDKDITVRGSWINNAGPSSFTAGTSTVILENDTMANRIITPNGAETFYNLHVNNLDTGLVIHNDINIAEQMRFIEGVVIPEDDTEEIVFRSGASWSDAGNQSFAAGWVRSVGFDGSNFREYPTGYLNTDESVQVYMPAGVRAESASGTAAYRIRYFHENFDPAFNTAPGQEPPTTLPLQDVSTCNWWDIQRVSGSIAADVQLTYDVGSDCYDLNDVSTLTVSRFDGSSWTDGGSASVTGNTVSGSVRAGSFNAFSPFTIGALGGGNALPISLLTFTAEAVDDHLVRCEWTTASETNNDYFTVERSIDGKEWTDIGRVQGAGNSNQALHYTFADDAPYTGVSYYRLRQTDFDGATEAFEPRAVQIGGRDFGLHQVYRTETAVDFVYSATAPYLTVEIFDMSGRLIHGDIFDHYDGQSRGSMEITLAKGIYLLRLGDGDSVESLRFFY